MSGAGARAPAPSQGQALFSNAVRSLADPILVGSDRYKQRVTWETRGSVSNFVRFASAFLRECQRRSFPIIIAEAWRDGVRQDELFAKGFSKARAGQSAHNHGMAGDFIHLTRGWNLNKQEWLILGAIGHDVARKQKQRISWGGDDVALGRMELPVEVALGLDVQPVNVDRFRWDPAHFEMLEWKELRYAS